MFENNYPLKAVFVTLMIAAGSFATPGNAGLKIVEPEESETDDQNGPNKWAGRWHSEAGATLTIHNIDTFIEITGTDQNSNFQVHCLPTVEPDSDSLNCVGYGRQIDGNPFIYSSKIILESTDRLLEQWSVNAWDDGLGKIQKATGKEQFSRSKEGATR